MLEKIQVALSKANVVVISGRDSRHYAQSIIQTVTPHLSGTFL